MPAPSEVVAAHGTLRDKERLERYKHFEEEDRERITQVARRRATQGPHRVGALYDEIIKLRRGLRSYPDSIFQEHTFSTQASPDDWGADISPIHDCSTPGGV